ncbi:MAG: hypothetical protein AB7P37_23255 [Ramlibacter sp.]
MKRRGAAGGCLLVNDLLPYSATPGTDVFKTIDFLRGPNNAGNLVFLDAINELIPGLANLTSGDLVRRAGGLPAGTTVLLPLANFMSATWEAPEGFLDALEKFKPVLLSVGVQADAGAQASDVVLSADCLRLLEQVRHAGTVAGARGAFSQQVLQRHGIEAIVIGCPSLYVGIPANIKPPVPRRLAVCTNNSFTGELRDLAARVNSFSVAHASGFVCQNEEGVILDVMGIPEPVADFMAAQSDNPQYAGLLRNRVFSYGYYNDGRYEWGQMHEWFAAHARFFLALDEWRAFAGSFDLSVGPRFHGNVVALQAGVPAVFVPPDVRVQEMVDFAGLPQVAPTVFQQMESPGDLLAYCSMDRFYDGACACSDELQRFLHTF